MKLLKGEVKMDIILKKDINVFAGNEVIKSEQKNKNYYYDNDIKYFNISQIQRIIDKTKNEYYKYIYLLFFELGTRFEEASGIRFKDIDFISNKVKVKTLKQKKESYRYLIISDVLAKMILHFKSKYNLSDDDFILSKRNKKPITIQAFNKKFKSDVREILGDTYADKAHSHTFRHSRAIFLLNNGMNVRMLQKFLGHSSIANTLIYSKYSINDIDNAVIAANKNLYQ